MLECCEAMKFAIRFYEVTCKEAFINKWRHYDSKNCQVSTEQICILECICEVEVI